MRSTQLRRALLAGVLLAAPAPASAQDVPVAPAPPTGAVEAEPCTCPARRGLFGWRARMARCKRHLQDKALGYPEEFQEWPLGWALYAHGRTQVANAEAAALIFNHYDFIGDTPELNLRGRDKLAVVADRLPGCFAPVVVERTPWAPGLDQARRLVVVRGLTAGPFPVPAERVVIGPPVAQGLRGTESMLINANRLSQVATGGYGGGNGGADVAGFDGSGLSGAAVTQGAAGATP